MHPRLKAPALALLASALALSTDPAAHAAGGPYEPGAFTALRLVREAGAPAPATLPGLEGSSRWGFGLRFGYDLPYMAELESEVAYLPRTSSARGQGLLRLHLVQHVLEGAIRPFWGFGLGAGTGRDAGCCDLQPYLGIGVKLQPWEHSGFRLDGRTVFVPSEHGGLSSAAANPDHELQLGFFLDFGSRNAPDPAVPAVLAQATDAPPPAPVESAPVSPADSRAEEGPPSSQVPAAPADVAAAESPPAVAAVEGPADRKEVPTRELAAAREPMALAPVSAEPRVPSASATERGTGPVPAPEATLAGASDDAKRTAPDVEPPVAAAALPPSAPMPPATPAQAPESPEVVRPTVTARKAELPEPQVTAAPSAAPGEHVATLLFELNSFELTRESTDVLDAVAKRLRRDPALRLRIEGHCDKTGTAEFNRPLSELRGHEVRRFLVGQGIEEGRLEVVGLSFDHPVGDNGTHEGRVKNRRVELLISAQGGRRTERELPASAPPP